MPGVFVEARERKTFPVSDTVRALVSGSCHGCPRVSPCCPVSYCLPKTLILIDAVAWRVVVYLMVKETNGLPKLVVVGSNPIARSKSHFVCTGGSSGEASLDCRRRTHPACTPS